MVVEKEKGKSSLVWEHFGFEEFNEEQHHTMCKICYKGISVPLGNTTNLLNRLKLKHNVTHDKLIKKTKRHGHNPHDINTESDIDLRHTV